MKTIGPNDHIFTCILHHLLTMKENTTYLVDIIPNLDQGNYCSNLSMDEKAVVRVCPRNQLAQGVRITTAQQLSKMCNTAGESKPMQ